MSNSMSVDRNTAVATMAAVAVHDSSRTVTDDPHATTSAATDLHIKGTDTQPHDAAETSGCSTNNDLSTSSKTSPAKISPNASGNPNAEAACTAIQSISPVPIIYPPRRPNIFGTREKHLRYPAYGRGPVGPDTVDITAQELEAADGFSMADMEKFQAEIKEKMRKKTEMFMNMVRQSDWQQRRVEDLGEVFTIEN